MPKKKRRNYERLFGMDSIGRKLDRQCILTLYLRPSKLQLALLLPERTTDAVAKVLDGLELLLGRKAFSQFVHGIKRKRNGAPAYGCWLELRVH